jgi:hypothetical protein
MAHVQLPVFEDRVRRNSGSCAACQRMDAGFDGTATRQQRQSARPEFASTFAPPARPPAISGGPKTSIGQFLQQCSSQTRHVVSVVGQRAVSRLGDALPLSRIFRRHPIKYSRQRHPTTYQQTVSLLRPSLVKPKLIILRSTTDGRLSASHRSTRRSTSRTAPACDSRRIRLI